MNQIGVRNMKYLSHNYLQGTTRRMLDQNISFTC